MGSLFSIEREREREREVKKNNNDVSIRRIFFHLIIIGIKLRVGRYKFTDLRVWAVQRFNTQSKFLV